MDLSAGVALVTGGGTGLGREIAVRLAAHGLDVAVNYASSKDEAESVAAAIEKTGRGSVAVHADVSLPGEVAAMVGDVEAALGPVDVLVNNAGVTRYIPFRELDQITLQDWQDVLAVNVIGAFNCVQAIGPAMADRGGGAILNVSSISPYVANGSSLPYTVSKAALISLTECLCRALPTSVRVNAVAPSWMDTVWLDKHLPEEVSSRVRSAEYPSVPVEKVAQMAIGLILNDAVSGQTVVIDGGGLWRS